MPSWLSALAPSDYIASIAIAISLLALLRAWRADRRSLQDMEPVLTAEPASWKAPQGWQGVYVTLRSVHNVGYAVPSVSIVRPRRASIAKYDEALADDGTGSVEIARGFAAEHGRRKIQTRLAVEAEGMEPRYLGGSRLGGTGDTNHLRLLVHMPPGARGPLCLRFDAVSERGKRHVLKRMIDLAHR